jgi:hypothetical protein
MHSFKRRGWSMITSLLAIGMLNAPHWQSVDRALMER